MASNSLRGHGGQRHIAYNLSTNEEMLYDKSLFDIRFE